MTSRPSRETVRENGRSAVDTAALEGLIGYAFRDPSLLVTAATTPACRMDRPRVSDNQRLEFLGDAVFGLLAGEAVYRAFPDEQEGSLTVRRAHLVSGKALAAVAERIGLRDYLRVNRGAAPFPSGAKPLADAMEALMGAVWLDGGLEAARAFFARLDLPVGGDCRAWDSNPKGALQVCAQAQHPPRRPEYTVDCVKGPSHAPIVTVTVRVKGLGEATATACSQRQAEIDAAARLMELIGD